MGNGVKVVGVGPAERHQESGARRGPAPAGEERADTGRAAGSEDRTGAPAPRPSRLAAVLGIVAVLGIAGTIYFWQRWSGLDAQNAAAAAARQSAGTFLVDLTNFDAKSVDADFARLTAMATGPFAKQANQFFNSSIRQQLETALASSRGQVRSLYVQTVSGGQATVYGVIDQLYVNRTLSAPQSDVLRVVVQMSQIGGAWKIADVTVLEGPSLASPSTGSSSGK